MMYENFRHTHGSGSGAGKNKVCVHQIDGSCSLQCLRAFYNYISRV